MTARAWRLHLERCVRAACVLEATACKPGNVHPRASFVDLCHADFVRSAELVAPVLARTPESGVGAAVLEAVTCTRAVVGRNTNLGIVLLVAPLAAVPEQQSLAEGIDQVLAGLSQADAALVYQAIRAAHPGGLGAAPQEDVSGEPTGTLVEAMRLAADRDAIAAQYANGFATVLQFGVPFLRDCRDFASQWESAIIELQLRLMARAPDTLIVRKRGWEDARQSAQRAAGALDAGGLESEEGRRQIGELDLWLRAEGHSRNPGATADLITACLFAVLRDRLIELPVPLPV